MIKPNHYDNTLDGRLEDGQNRLGVSLFNAGWHDEAVSAMKGAVELLTKLSEGSPVSFSDYLAEAQHNLVVHLAKLGRHEEAVSTAQAAIDLLVRQGAMQAAIAIWKSL